MGERLLFFTEAVTQKQGNLCFQSNFLSISCNEVDDWDDYDYDNDEDEDDHCDDDDLDDD